MWQFCLILYFFQCAMPVAGCWIFDARGDWNKNLIFNDHQVKCKARLQISASWGSASQLQQLY